MEVALGEKQKCQDEADATALTIDLANRLVNGLASEKIRWIETLEMLVYVKYILYIFLFTIITILNIISFVIHHKD